MGRWAAYRLLRRLPSLSKPSSVPLYPSQFSLLSSDPTIQFFPFKPFSSSASSSSTALAHDFDYGFRDLSHFYVDEDRETAKIPVKAYFLSTSINLRSMQAENAGNVVPPTSRTSNYVTFRFCNLPSETMGLGVENNAICNRYMVVFQYGSAVLFNVDDHEVDFFLNIARRHASGLLSELRKDDYMVKEKPTLAEDMQGGADYIILKHLDTDGIRIIGSVLGQSIALDYFVSQVDIMVEEFANINRGMEKTGTFTMHRKKLFQLVGRANSNLADVILKVGLFDRSEIAWRDAKYAQINEYLREEYEVAQRFGNLDIKLKFVEHNIHFLQEVLQNRRSDLLEWCIIVLLSIENVISLYEIIRDSAAGSV
ncbi:protein RETARDED ROOT GROWTH, mitochondrial-like [Amaranthus tricolor]|uniref:protein RETARDED ROOT GROWTH, mitochondrial-like n=1 Tax=Amaranthus tricolor TaxID=29722 RepID=UPI002586E418|nr:protein RETARDED ROOT GROWTH, mitochondrial-like [Amaranthus tricolor]